MNETFHEKKLDLLQISERRKATQEKNPSTTKLKELQKFGLKKRREMNQEVKDPRNCRKKENNSVGYEAPIFQIINNRLKLCEWLHFIIT